MERDATEDFETSADERPTFFREPIRDGSDDRPTFFTPHDSRPTTIQADAQNNTGAEQQGKPSDDGASGFRCGETVLGKYRIVRVIENSGQEAEVFEAEGSGSRFFIKQLYKSRSTEDRKKRLAAIKDRLLSLEHPNLVQPISVTLDSSRICEVYSFVDGPSLTQWRRDHEPKPEELRQLLSQMASALHYLHTHDFAHRDVKPENITVVDGSPLKFVLTDYGLLVATDEGGRSNFGGTDIYLPPERQGRAGTVERNKDLFFWDWWALGRVLQEMIVGRDCVSVVMERSGSSKSAASDAFFDILAGHYVENFSCMPGMVELMSLGQFAAFERPLKGLLSANFRKRWGFEEVQQWLAGAEPTEYYAEPASGIRERAFVSGGLKFSSLREVAQHFAKAENWADGERQIRGGLQNSELRNYISDVLEDTKLAQQIRECNALAVSLSSDARTKFDPDAVDAVVTAIALTCIGNSEFRQEPMPLVIRGEIVDANYLAQASFSTDAARRDILRIMFGQDCRNLIDTLGTAHFSGVLAAIEGAEQVRRELGSATDQRIADALPLVEYASVIADGPKALEQLTDTVSLGKNNFHHSDYTRLQSLVARTDLSVPELRVVAFAFRHPDVTKFVTHGEFEHDERERLTTLRGNLVRAEQLAWRAFIPLCRPIINADWRVLALIGFIVGLFGVRSGWYVPFYSAGVLAAMGRLAHWFMTSFDNTAALMDESFSQLNSEVARLLNTDAGAPFLSVHSAIRKFNHDVTQLRSGGVQRISPSVKWQPLTILAMLLFGFLFGPVLMPILAKSDVRRVARLAAPSAKLARNAPPMPVHTAVALPQPNVSRAVAIPRRVRNRPPAAVTRAKQRSTPAPAPTSTQPEVARTSVPTHPLIAASAHTPRVSHKQSSSTKSEASLIAGLVDTSTSNGNACEDSSVTLMHEVSPQAPSGMAPSAVSGASGVVRVYVNASGNAASETILRSTGDPNLDRSILQAATASTYSPAKSACKAQDGSIDVTVTFP